MATSLPSHEIISADVPKPKAFDAQFIYNFFVADESVSDAPPSRYQDRPADARDASFQQFITSRVPRFIKIDLGMSSQIPSAKGESSAAVRAASNARRQGLPPNLIASNIKKLLTDDQFTSNRFVSVDFHDGEIDDRVHEFVSGSYVQRTLSSPPTNTSHYAAAIELDKKTPADVSPHVLTKALGVSHASTGARFFDSRGEQKRDEFFRELKGVNAHLQINGKFLHDIIDRSIRDPHAPYASDLLAIHRSSKSSQRAARAQFSPSAAVSDYKNIVPYVSTQRASSFNAQDTNAELVGFVIDKTEILSDGSTRVHDPIIVESARATMTVDMRVKYGATYAYTVRSVALFTIAAVDDDTGDLVLARVLVSSKPTHTVYVACVDNVAPPAPADFNFSWDYHDNKLLVYWTFPPNSQRDIKKFQVFRRADTSAPFELVKQYDFDDSAVPAPQAESPVPALVERVSSPTMFWIDEEFSKRSSFIYAVASIDAHGMTSNFSAQFKLTFDSFKNKLVKSLISHAGAPKPYPNLYLEADVFVETIRDAGHGRATLYFNPTCYSTSDDAGRTTQTVATSQTRGKYVLQFINLDAQKDQHVSITIDDMMTKRK